MHPAALSPALPHVVALVRLPDAIMLLLVLLFGVWGAMRGTARQVLSMLVLGGSLFAAGRLAPVLEPTVAKVAGLAPEQGLAAAWAVALVVALAVGAVFAAFLGQHLPQSGRGGWDRLLGGSLGVVKGACVIVIVGYALLGGLTQHDSPALSRPAPIGAAPAAQTAPLVGAVRGSASARWMATGADLLLHWLAFPRWIHARVEAVNERLEVGREPAEAGRARRPRGS